MLAGSHRRARLVSALAAGFLLSLVPAPAGAQGPANLAQENEELKERVASLENQLAQARQRISALNDEIATLRKQLAAGGRPAAGGSPGAAPGAAPGGVPADPMGSPESLFNTLSASYNQNFGGEPYETRADQNRLRRSVSTWVRDMQREHRGNVRWRIRILDTSQAGDRGGPVRFQVVDATGSVNIGPESEVVFPSRIARDISSATPDEVWILQGRMSAMPSVNRTRIEEDDDPEGGRYLGPFADFGYELAIESIEPAS